MTEEEDAREGQDSGEGALIAPRAEVCAVVGGAPPSQPAAKHGFGRPRKRGPRPMAHDPRSVARGPWPAARGPRPVAPYDRRVSFLLSFTVHSTLSFRALAVAWASWSLTAASGATADSW